MDGITKDGWHEYGWMGSSLFVGGNIHGGHLHGGYTSVQPYFLFFNEDLSSTYPSTYESIIDPMEFSRHSCTIQYVCNAYACNARKRTSNKEMLQGNAMEVGSGEFARMEEKQGLSYMSKAREENRRDNNFLLLSLQRRCLASPPTIPSCFCPSRHANND